jgi:hypothetical protein
MTTRQNTAYYIVGTKDELLERGIIVKEGGARVLFIFGKAGETLQPARDLDPGQFTPINLTEVREITLPDSTAEYLIASRQDLAYLEVPPVEGEKPRVRGSVRIGAPEQFWLPSRSSSWCGLSEANGRAPAHQPRGSVGQQIHGPAGLVPSQLRIGCKAILSPAPSTKALPSLRITRPSAKGWTRGRGALDARQQIDAGVGFRCPRCRGAGCSTRRPGTPAAPRCTSRRH